MLRFIFYGCRLFLGLLVVSDGCWLLQNPEPSENQQQKVKTSNKRLKPAAKRDRNQIIGKSGIAVADAQRVEAVGVALNPVTV